MDSAEELHKTETSMEMKLEADAAINILWKPLFSNLVMLLSPALLLW